MRKSKDDLIHLTNDLPIPLSRMILRISRDDAYPPSRYDPYDEPPKGSHFIRDNSERYGYSGPSPSKAYGDPIQSLDEYDPESAEYKRGSRYGRETRLTSLPPADGYKSDSNKAYPSDPHRFASPQRHGYSLARQSDRAPERRERFNDFHHPPASPSPKRY